MVKILLRPTTLRVTQPFVLALSPTASISALPQELCQFIFLQLDFLDLSALLQTSQAFYAAVTAFLDGEFNILLTRYGLPAEAFRDLMNQTGAIIGGSAALNWLCRNHIISPSLSIFVPRFKELFFTHLLYNAGYKWDQDQTKARENKFHQERAGIHDIMTFSTKQSNKPVIRIVRTGDNVLIPIAKAFTTAHMTFLTADSIHTLYPRLTFARRAFVLRQFKSRVPLRANPSSLELLPGHASAKIDSLAHNGFDVQRKNLWSNGPCGETCPALQQSVMRCGFRLKLSDAFPDTDKRLGSDIRFVLDDTCHNKYCPYWDERVIN